MTNRTFKDFVDKVTQKRPGVRAEMEIQKNLREALVHARKAEGLTQRDLADRADWKQPYVARLEGTGQDMRQLRIATVEQYLTACNLKLGLILYRENKDGVSVVHASPMDGSDRITQCFSTLTELKCAPPPPAPRHKRVV